jgi:ABC transporter with metal-binding/Fe-S-binding domain ATP-binding protein
MKAAVLFSGGKDSAYSLYKEKNNYEIVCLISLFPEKSDSYMFHYPNVEFIRYQAESMNLPLIIQKTKAEKEKELKDLEIAIKKAIKEYKIEVLISGALASSYQKSRIEDLCRKLKIKSVAPLWHVDPENYLKELIKNKFEVIITGIAADGLNESLLGRKINEELIQGLKKLKIHLGAEGGEYETFVLNCPLFSKEIEIIESEKIMENNCTGRLKIKKIKFNQET